MKVLIVDDSLTELTRLKSIVERVGHDVVTAKNGKEALVYAQSEKPDLIFMDIVMPQMDGFQATRILSNQEDTKHIPIILVSTKRQEADVKWAKQQGASHLIGKPYVPSDIIEQLLTFQR